MPRKRTTRRSKGANGAGGLTWRESRQRWEARCTVGTGSDGRPIRRTFTGRTQAEALGKMSAAIDAVNAGLAVPDNRTTVAEFATWWLTEVLPGEGLAPKTEHWYRDVLGTYVVPLVGTKRLTGPKALTVGDVESMTAALGQRGLSARVQVAARVSLGKLLRAAEQRGLVSRNVARLAKRPRDRGVARAVKAHTPPEIGALLGELGTSRWHPVAVVGVTTGLRPGELLALHWADVKLSTAEPHLSVRLALSHVDGPSLKAPKRARSYRTVPLPPEAVRALRAWRKTQAEDRLAAGAHWSDAWGDLVFTNEIGEPLRVDSFRHALVRALPGSHPHRLRHTYATHLLEAGVPIHHVAELLGDTVAVVESTYSHVLRPKHEIASVISGVLGSA